MDRNRIQIRKQVWARYYLFFYLIYICFLSARDFALRDRLKKYLSY